ncbi:MAG: class I SAM-dependent methyltransferase [Gammaproteobacteria bacterium]|nr:class I SAM-dependent methyltransferase [Gammaproteobacteria bacterium]
MEKKNCDNWEKHWSDYSESTEKIPSHSFRRMLIKKILAKECLANASIIDFGSGQGDLLTFISSQFKTKQLLGLELTKIGVEISQKKLPTALFIQKNLLDNTPIMSNNTSPTFENYAEYGLCLEVLEHLDEPAQLLRNIHYYLKPKGKIIITVPGGKMAAFEKHIGHRMHYTKKTLGVLLKSAGYTQFSIQAAGFPFFNLYKMITILRGKKLIADVKAQHKQNFSNIIGSIVMKIFNLLFKLNLNFLPFGWQLIAIVEVNK